MASFYTPAAFSTEICLRSVPQFLRNACQRGARTFTFQARLPNGRYKQIQTGAPFTSAGLTAAVSACSPGRGRAPGLPLWSADRLMRPTFRNLTDSYESWAYRKGLLRRIALLEKQRLIERDPVRPDDRLYRLTWQGRLHALGGRDPLARWSREWDGRWRLVLFDVPTKRSRRT